MGIVNNMKSKLGFVTVQIEGFFTERFINLCKINNIKIWDIRNIITGVVRFKTSIYDFKKLRKIASKTKCKVKIKKKEGLYFLLFKYRKRKIVGILLLIAVIFCALSSTFIWQIEVKGNINLSSDEVKKELKNSGIYVGKNKIGLDKKQVVNTLRTKLNDASWIGIDIEGSKVEVEIVEKTRLEGDKIIENNYGNIVSTKAGIITKIIAENGTAKYKHGSYIGAGEIAIEGVLYGKYMEPLLVSPKGVLKINCEYSYENTYLYKQIIKNYTEKVRYTIGITIDSKENMLNYLNKNEKYDITKNSKKFNVFGNKISFDIYKCQKYDEIEIIKSEEELIDIAKKDASKYIEKILVDETKEGNLVEERIDIIPVENGIKISSKYIVNEEVGKFIAGESVIRTKEGIE